ncbi:unnamed protein product [Hymenolepis diminuta]|uniref:Reverse transcriptase domain-containing protein n=1 Tax=Hymenolepis diminuta TaxID=6216 RepID=A0A564YV95_HYMDI|nr:unnamed protein product [Hymenolepis diminuta]
MFNVLEPKIQNVICPQVRTKEMMKRFATVFEDTLGLFSKQAASCVLRSKRPIPITPMKMVKNKLVRLEQVGVLKPVTYSKWAALIVVVRKVNGSTRICVNFSTGFNSLLEDDHHPLPVIGILFTIPNNGKAKWQKGKNGPFGYLPSS